MELLNCIKNHIVLGHSSVENPVRVMFGVDSNFIIPFGIVMTSVLINNPGGVIYLFINKYSNKDIELIHQTVARYRAECHIFTVDINNLGVLPTTKYWSEATYYRIIAARYLEKYMDKVLYLDADTFCRGNLQNLFMIQMNTQCAAIVEDFCLMGKRDELEYIHHNLHIEGKYFNAGVILINLHEWNKNNISEKAIKYLLGKNNKKWRFLDQDVLNISLTNKVIWLPEKYNAQLEYIKRDFTLERLQNTCILHFTGAKPWSKYYYPNLLHPTQFDKEYRACYEQSAWNDTNFLNPTLSFCYRMEARRFLQEGKIFSSFNYRLKYLKEKITRG